MKYIKNNIIIKYTFMKLLRGGILTNICRLAMYFLKTCVSLRILIYFKMLIWNNSE